MRYTKIKKIIITSVVALTAIDGTLLFAAQNNWNAQVEPVAATTNHQDSVDQFSDWVNNNSAKPQAKQVATAKKVAVVKPTLQQTGIQTHLSAQPTADQQQAFKESVAQSMPMTPSQIIKLKQMIAASEQAAATSPGVPPKPVSTSMFVNLAPGTTPPVVSLAKGYISSLVFNDASGNAWPVESVDNGNPQAFNVTWNKKGNTIMIQALKAYTNGNLAVKLKGLSTPVMITLIPGQKTVDYRADLRISGLSPTSKHDVVGNALPVSANQQLLNVLDGVGPDKGKALSIAGNPNCQVWVVGKKLYLRLPAYMDLLSPGYMGMMRSPDGTRAYEIDKTPSILVTENGKTVYKHIEGVA